MQKETNEDIQARTGETDVAAVDSRTASANESQADHDRRAAFIQSLRDCADFLDTHPDVRAPRFITLNVFLDTREAIVAQAKAASWRKVYGGEWFYLTRTFGQDLSLAITVERDVVCRKVVTGTRVVPAEPAQPERIVDNVEWVCDDALLSGANGEGRT